MKSFRVWGAFCAGLMLTGAAWEQDYPIKNITVIVPFPPGGINDAAVRILQPEMERRLGKSLIIDNRAGAGGAVGTQAVARAAPDGHTLLAVASSHAVAPAVNPNLSYDAVKDFAPIIMIARDPMLFLVNSKVPAKDIGEFVALAKAKPGAVSYASAGQGSILHLGAELMATLSGMAFGGWISGTIFDLTGSYATAFLNGVLWNGLNIAIALWLLLRDQWRRAPA